MKLLKELEQEAVLAYRQKIRTFMEEKSDLTKKMKNKKKKILFVIPRKCLSKGAYAYIVNNKDILEYKIIPMYI